MYDKIPVPITFNPYKHHFLFLLKELEKWKTMGWELVEKEILSIGNNLIDFYLGNLSIPQICIEINNFFRNKNITDKSEFLIWLDALNYKKVQLSDQSDWLIKEGINPERFIHIHPAKFSEHTIRIRATTLKTIIALKSQSVPLQKEIKANLFTVNTIRHELLGLSPIKSLAPGTGILRLWELFEKTN
jgi:hypothetical protein